MNNISALEKRYNSEVMSLDRLLKILEERYPYTEPPAQKILDQEPSVDTFVTPEGVVMPDEKYVKKLIENLSELRKKAVQFVGIHPEYQKFERGLYDLRDKIESDQGEFDNPEDIMTEVHELIEKYIYGSDSKVFTTEWPALEEYIEKAGYSAVQIHAGEDVRPYMTYFTRPISATGGIPFTVKQIQLKPYTLKFHDGDKIHEMKLCGKCTFYK